MKKILLLNKKEGETPLEALESFRRKYKVYKDVPMTYAGRLDPLVSGLLLVLAGNIRREKEKYLGLSKEYDFTILFGFATDTYDILGKVVSQDMMSNQRKDLEKKIKENLKFFTGTFTQKYPMYSSKTVDGKALFEYAREGIKIERPEREAYVKSLKFFNIRNITAKGLLENIERRIGKVKGDFRQVEILKIWRKKLKSHINSQKRFFLADFHITCNSGTYVRAVAHDLGERMGVSSLALTIRRTKIGKWSKIQI